MPGSSNRFCIIKYAYTMKHFNIFVKHILFSLSILVGGTNFALSQTSFEQKPIKILGQTHPLVNITEVLIKNDKIIVLTSTFPSIHIYMGKNFDQYVSFGAEGNGPMEMKFPKSVDASGDSLYVLDFRPGACKIVHFSIKGEFITSIPVRNYDVCHSLKVLNQINIVEVGDLFGANKKIIKVNEEGQSKEILEYEDLSNKRLLVEGGPMNSINISNPFTGTSHWGVDLLNATILYWGAQNNTLEKIDINSGKTEPFVRISDNKIPFKEEYISNWIEEKYSSEQELFGYRDFYKNVKKEIKSSIEVPGFFPLMSRIEVVDSGDIWIKRAYYTREGEIWSSVGNQYSNNELYVKFPPNRQIMDFSDELIAAITTNKEGEEIVEIFNIKTLTD